MLRTYVLLSFFLFISGAVCASYEITDSFGKHRFEHPPKRVVVTDWAILEQVLELGVKPVGAPELAAYQYYVQQPGLPQNIVDIGLRISPTLNVIKSLKPDLIILGTNQKNLARPFSMIAEVMYYKNFSEHYRSNADKARLRFKQIATIFQKSELAEIKLKAMDSRIAELKSKIQQRFGNTPPKVTTIRFSSKKKCLVYGANSIPSHVLSLLGIESEYPLKRSQWGEKEIDIDQLQIIKNGYIFYFQPVDQNNKVFESKEWQTLPIVQTGRVKSVSPAWSYGGAMSILYIAEAITNTLLSIEH